METMKADETANYGHLSIISLKKVRPWTVRVSRCGVGNAPYFR